MNRIRSQSGFSLIEAMVALLVIAVGLLGIAGMQAMSINSTATSRVRALAAIQASNMAAYMAANGSYWRNAYGTNVTVTPAGASATLSDSTLNGINSNCESASCTPQQMAAYDLKQWGSSNQLGSLPSGMGAVVCGNTGVCTIIAGWKEKTMAPNADGNTLAPAATYYRMVVQP